jgi:hypothetical protein
MPSHVSRLVIPDAEKPREAGLFMNEFKPIRQLALVTSAA